MLHYKAGTSYLGKEHWKMCFVVLSNGILYQYPDRTDVIPLLSVNMGGAVRWLPESQHHGSAPRLPGHSLRPALPRAEC